MIGDEDVCEILRDLAKSIEEERPMVMALIQACRNADAALTSDGQMICMPPQFWSAIKKAAKAFDAE